MKPKPTISLFFSILYSIFSNGQNSKSTTLNFNKVTIDTLFTDTISIRTLNLEKDKVWFAADKNRYGYFDLTKKERIIKKIENLSHKLEFRSSALTPTHLFTLSIASPAFLYKIDKTKGTTELVYQNNHEKIFFDSLQFWNTKEGIALGDPIDDYFKILITRDAGTTWKELPTASFFKNTTEEGAFAASNTNIILQGHHTWLVSGGKKARVFYSSDKGNSWQVYETPIVQGKTMTGIFTGAFYDSKIGCIAGGDYELPKQNHGNKAITFNGGKSWELIGENKGPGYISCVQFIPKSKGKGLLTVGATGIHYSKDSGTTWHEISSDPTLYTLRFLNPTTAIAAGKNKMIRIVFKTK